MKIRLIYPRFRKFLEEHRELSETLKEFIVGDFTMPPSLALPIIAALTPKNIEVNITDDNKFQKLDFDEKCDLVVISCFTPQAERAYEISDEFRKRGTKTIMGGIHPSAIPNEVLEHADSVCIGEVELVWKQILKDVESGTLNRIYKSDKLMDLADSVVPKREIFDKSGYNWNAHLVQVMRGCPAKCIGCPIPDKEGVIFRFKPIDLIVNEIRNMHYREFYFTDDTVMLPGKKNIRFMKTLMKQTKELKQEKNISIFLASTMMMINEPDFYRILHEGGVNSMYTIFGFDPVSKKIFSDDCTKDARQKAIDLIRMNEDNGIHFFASFGIGFDEQTPVVRDRILKFAEDARIDLAEFYIITPFPGTIFGNQIEKENRILHRKYSLWNHANVVFKPKNFTEDSLMQSYFYLWKEFYKNKKPEATIRSFDIVP